MSKKDFRLALFGLVIIVSGLFVADRFGTFIGIGLAVVGLLMLGQATGSLRTVW